MPQKAQSGTKKAAKQPPLDARRFLCPFVFFVALSVLWFMPYPHIIRLRGPWTFEVVEQTAGRGDLPRAGRTTVPAEWGEQLGRDFRGRVRYRRSFNPPSTLDPHERLWLVTEGVDAFGRLSLNGRVLGTVDGYALPASFDITDVIAARNQIDLDVDLPDELTTGNVPLRPGREDLPGGPIGEVRLEIRSSWHIESLAIWSVPGGEKLLASGRIAGDPATNPMAVVVSGCEREICYQEAAVGERFRLEGVAEGFPIWMPENPQMVPVEVKLLSGGSAVWQTVLHSALQSPLEASATRMEQILPDAAYDQFDRTGRSVVQQVPHRWSEQVCSRLAHHPSVAAWSSLPGQPLNDGNFGRLWI